MSKTMMVAAAVLAFVAYRYFIGPQMAVNDADWSAARPELAKTYTELVGAMGLDVDTDAGRAVVKCITLKSIDFLNGTPCQYAYNESTTSRERHLAAQRMCLNNAQYDRQGPTWARACLLAHGADDWPFYQGLIEQQVMEISVQSKIPKPEAQTFAKCMAEKLVSRLAQTDCKPLNHEAAEGEDLLRFDLCIAEPAVAKDYRDIQEACRPVTAIIPDLRTVPRAPTQPE